jgi:hypothetical protein
MLAAVRVPKAGRLGAMFVREYHAFDPARFIAAMPQTEHGDAAYLASQFDEPSVVILVAD